MVPVSGGTVSFWWSLLAGEEAKKSAIARKFLYGMQEGCR